MRVLTLALVCTFATGTSVVAPHLRELLLLQIEGGGRHVASSTVFMHSVGQGMHMDLNLTVQAQTTSAQSHVSLLCVFVLPPGCYADMDELRSRHRGFHWSRGVRVHAAAATSNPELLAEEAPSEVLGIEFVDMPGGSPMAHSFTLPVHLRYHRATSHSASGGVDYASVSIPPPTIFLCPSPAGAGADDSSTRQGGTTIYTRIVTTWQGPLRPLLGCRPTSPTQSGDALAGVVLRMPVGDLDALPAVQAVTWAALAITTAWLGAALLW